LDRKALIYVLTCFSRLSSDDPLGLVYELLWDYFVPNDYATNFDFFLEICGHIVHGHVLPLVSHVLVAPRLLALEKQAGGVWPIVIGKVIYWLFTCTLVIQFKDTFVEHFSPH
jgi:hypothetical protein